MSDQTTVTDHAVVPPGATAGGSALDSGPLAAVAPLATQVSERPEVAVGGAFVGGLLAALILKRLAR